MRISELPVGTKIYTQLASTALAVLSRRVDGWCVYIAGVKGWKHNEEWQRVADEGDKAKEPIAIAIVKHLFHPGFEVDLPYAD